MKNKLLFTLLASIFLLSVSSCKKDKESTEPGNCEPTLSGCFKGRLEIQDICGNYTIKVLEGDLNSSLFQASWQHPKTGVTYENVFSLGNICSFPNSIKQGDTFYFTIRDTKKDASCVQCLAYAPTPNKALSINVTASPCIKTTN